MAMLRRRALAVLATGAFVDPEVTRRYVMTGRHVMRSHASRAAWLAGVAFLVVAPASRPGLAEPASRGSWIETWVAMPQLTEPGNLPPPPFTTAAGVFADSTVRQTLHTSIGGRRLRLRISNAFGDTALTITSTHIALPDGGSAGVSAIRPGSDRALTFQGHDSVTIPAGAQAVSDAVRFEVAPASNLTVTIYLATGQPSQNITSHPGSRTTIYMVAGNHVSDTDLPSATRVAHWYFLSGLEVQGDDDAAGVVMLGDSLTDGRGSTTDQNDRWPDQLASRLRGRTRGDVAVLNQAAGGNRVLNDGLGPNLLARLDRDLLAHSAVRWTIVFEGINDIGTAAATEQAQRDVADELIRAYEQIIVRAHARSILVYGATLTPIEGSFYFDDTGFREAARQRVNHWIRTSGNFDAVIDFDRAVRDPAAPTIIAPALDSGDHLHLNPSGYKALADAVDLGLFRRH
jgi:lysophospholipase L1-like esterase